MNPRYVCFEFTYEVWMDIATALERLAEKHKRIRGRPRPTSAAEAVAQAGGEYYHAASIVRATAASVGPGERLVWTLVPDSARFIREGLAEARGRT